MVRGLDYYMRTTFEIVHGALGAQNSVLGGGRYDGLAEALGSRVHSPGVGFSIGEDRLVMAVENDHREDVLEIFVAPMNDAARRHVSTLAMELRRRNRRVEVAPEGKVKRMFELANSMKARFVLIVGDEEMSANSYKLKDMATGEQVQLTRDELLERFSGLEGTS